MPRPGRVCRDPGVFVKMTPQAQALVPSGIGPVDERVGGLQRGGTYLVVGAPGPEKLVAALQFVQAGIADGAPTALLTNAGGEELLDVAEAWGFDLRDAWRSGLLQIIGFREDFELRAMRSIAPDEVLEELDSVVLRDRVRVAVDPGTMFLSGGAKTLLGAAFLGWARRHVATVLTTFSVDGGSASLPSSADWLVTATTGRLLLEKRGDGLYQATLANAVPTNGRREETISLDLAAGAGLVRPERYPSRRGVDRAGIDEDRLLLVSLGGAHAADLEAWAGSAYEADVVSEPFEAVAAVQAGTPYGGVVVHSTRRQVREAVQACRAIRPLSRAAIVFVSDDAIRSTDRVHILEAGADDCLSGGVDFRELGLRIKQAIATGARPPSAGARGEDRDRIGSIHAQYGDGRVPRDIFRSEVGGRAEEPDQAFFCVLKVDHARLESAALEEVLSDQMRAEEGDLVTSLSEGCAILLQGARETQLGPFVERLNARLWEAGSSGDFSVEVLSHPSEGDRIVALLAGSNASRG